MIIGFLACGAITAFFGLGVWAMFKKGHRLLAIPMIGAGTLSLGLSLMFLSDLTGLTDFIRADFERDVANARRENAR